jgi:hypothetical protein
MPQGIGLQPVKRELEIFAAESCWPAMVRYTADKAGNSVLHDRNFEKTATIQARWSRPAQWFFGRFDNFVMYGIQRGAVYDVSC